MKTTKQVTFSISMPVFTRLRELKEVKSINLSAFVDKVLALALNLKESRHEY